MTDDRDRDDTPRDGAPGEDGHPSGGDPPDANDSLPPGWSAVPDSPASDPPAPDPLRPFGWEHGPWGQPGWGLQQQPPPQQPYPPNPYGPNLYADGFLPPGGLFALRPLRFSDVLQAVSTALTRAPKVYFVYPAIIWVGAGILMTVVQMLDPAYRDFITSAPLDQSSIPGLVGTILVTLLIGVVVSGLFYGTFAVTVNEQTQGRPAHLAQSWQATSPAAVRILVAVVLLSLTAIVVVLPAILLLIWGLAELNLGVISFGLFALLLLLVPLAWFLVRSSLLIAIVSVERIGVLEAFRRSFALTAGSFWRYFAVLAVMIVITGTAQSTINSMVGIGTVLLSTAENSTLLATLFGSGGTVSSVLVGFVTTPVLAVTVAVLHIDARIRHEGFGLTPGPGTTEPWWRS